MTGLIINEYLGHLNRDRQAANAMEQSELATLREGGLLKTLASLREAAAHNDIQTLLALEQASLRHALRFDANSPEEKRSLAAGIEQSAEALRCLALLCDRPEEYAKYSQDLYGAKDRAAGLPLDPFRKFIKSQAARLTNRLAGEGSLNKKSILRQRKENLSVINNRYMELQRRALGLAPNP